MAFRSAAIEDLSSDGPKSYQEHRTALLRQLPRLDVVTQMSLRAGLNSQQSAMQVLQARNLDGCEGTQVWGTYSCTLYAQVSGRSVAIATTRAQQRAAVL